MVVGRGAVSSADAAGDDDGAPRPSEPPPPRSSAPATGHRRRPRGGHLAPSPRRPTAATRARARSRRRSLQRARKTVVDHAAPRRLEPRKSRLATPISSVSTTALAAAKTLPGVVPEDVARAVARTMKSAASPLPKPAKPEPAPIVLPRTDLPPSSRAVRRDRWLWAVVAIVAAVLGVAIGAVVGAR